MCIRSDLEFPDNRLIRHVRFLEVSPHRLVGLLYGLVRSSELNCMILGLVLADGDDISGDLTVLHLKVACVSMLFTSRQRLRNVLEVQSQDNVCHGRPTLPSCPAYEQ
jgi:hypothetical protein